MTAANIKARPIPNIYPKNASPAFKNIPPISYALTSLAQPT